MFGRNVKLVHFDSEKPRSRRFYIANADVDTGDEDEKSIKKDELAPKEEEPRISAISRTSKTSKKDYEKDEDPNDFEKKGKDEPEDDLLWVGEEKRDTRKIRKKPMLSDEEILDFAVKQKIQEIFMFFFFLVVTTSVVLLSQTSSSAYLSRAMHSMFVDTPFMQLADEMNIPTEFDNSIKRPKPSARQAAPTEPAIPDDTFRMETRYQDTMAPEIGWMERSLGSADVKEDIQPALSPAAPNLKKLPESNPQTELFFSQVVRDANITTTPSTLLSEESAYDDPMIMEESSQYLRKDTPVIEPPDLLYKGYDWRGVLANAKNVFTERNLKRSSTIQDFWDFLDTTFINMIYWRYWYSNEDPIAHTEVDDMQLLFSSKLIGVPRMRQVRVRPDSCTIHPSVSHYFNSCITYYSSSVEDTSAIHPVSTLKETHPAWRYSLPVETDAMYSVGQISTYGRGGYYLDLEFTKPHTQKLFLELKQNKWVTRSTRAVIIDFTVYNANTNLFVVVKFIFEMPPTGGMIPNARFEPLKFFRYVDTYDYIVLGGEVVFIMFMFFFTAFIIHGLVQGGFRYLKHVGVQLTIVINIMGWACVALGAYRFFVVEKEAAELASTHNDTYPNFEHVRNVQADFNKLLSFTLFFAWVRAMLYLKYCQWIQPLFRSIGEAENRKALAGLTILFFCVIFALAQLGYLIFGDQAYQFRSLGDATTAQFSAIIGNFDYEEVHKIEPIMATIYLILYVFLIFFILLMLFAAVISHSYSISRATVAPVKDRLVSEYLCSFFYRFCTCGRAKRSEEQNVMEKIRKRFKSAGYTDLEIDMFFAKFGVDASTDFSQDQKKKVIDKLELRKFEFESIAVSPQTVANMQDDLERLNRNVDDLTKELNDNSQLVKMLTVNIDRMKSTIKAQKHELDKHRKETEFIPVVVEPESTSSQVTRPRKPDDDRTTSGYNHDLI